MHYWKLISYFVDLSVANAWLLFCWHMNQQVSKDKKSLLKFKYEIRNYFMSSNQMTPRNRSRPDILVEDSQPMPKRPQIVTSQSNASLNFDGVAHCPEAVGLYQAFARILCIKNDISLPS